MKPPTPRAPTPPALALILALAACGEAAPPRAASPGEAGRIALDAATLAYATCIERGAADVALGDQPAGSLAARVFLACRPQRTALLEAVGAFHRLGHPRTIEAHRAAIAEASVRNIEDRLRQDAVIAIIGRQSGPGTAI